MEFIKVGIAFVIIVGTALTALMVDTPARRAISSIVGFFGMGSFPFANTERSSEALPKYVFY